MISRAAPLLKRSFNLNSPDAVDSQITSGECGAKLIVGDKQLVAITRTILKNLRIILLDEATHHSDSFLQHTVSSNLHLQ